MAANRSVAVGNTSYRTSQQPTLFFVDLYNPDVVYIIDQTSIKRSDDEGATWNVGISLDTVATENHAFSNTTDFVVIKDMVFARGEPGTRFVVNSAGVFYTLIVAKN